MPSLATSPSVESSRAQAAKLELAGDFAGALAAYETALAASPDHPELLAGTARIAARLEMPEVAERFWQLARLQDPTRLEAIDGQARALAAQGRFDEAVALLQGTLPSHAGESRLWTTLGVILTQQGRTELALTFLDEAVRLDGRSATALYNRGAAHFDLAHLEQAAQDFAQARRASRNRSDTAMIEFAAATLALARRRLGEGWDGYEVRLSRDWPRYVSFEAPGRRWTPATRLPGQHLLVVAEQGLGDEIMFANVIPSVLDDLGPDGRLSLAVEPRLVELFSRSFPSAAVSAHATRIEGPKRHRSVPNVQRPETVTCWAPMASLPRRYRRSLEEFPRASGYLRPDPDRVAYWRDWFGPGPPAVGITWRSGKLLGDRRRSYPGLDDWSPVLRTAGVRFVNLQYGDCEAELDHLRASTGATILQAPGLNIREDIDDLAALCAALDLIVSVQNATGALAGACGCPVVFLSGPAPWPCLGTEGYPWYPAARCLIAPAFDRWQPVLAQAAAEVEALATGRS